MISHFVNVMCPREYIVKKYFYYLVHPNGTEELPYPNGCMTCVPDSRICQHCTDVVLQILISSLQKKEIVPNPIQTGLENFSNLLED